MYKLSVETGHNKNNGTDSLALQTDAFSKRNYSGALSRILYKSMRQDHFPGQ
jgi:hypothetical protein